MKLAIMQPYIFPYIGYFQLIHAADKFILFDDVNYINKGWINRNRILLNGQDYLFTIPLEKASQNRKINEINLSINNGWKTKLLKTFDFAYKKAPMFKLVYPIIENIIDFEERNLSSFISNSIEKICNYLEINTDIVLSSSQYNVTHLKGQNKILEICRIEKAGIYINPSGGSEIYKKEEFEKHNMKLLFLKSKPSNYKQFRSDFVPFLSIIEVSSSKEQELINVNLFFNTPDGSLIFATCSSAEKLEKGKSTYHCVIPAKTLNDNTYLIDLMVVAKGSIALHDIKGVLTIHGNEDKRSMGWLGKFPGLIRPQYFKWSKINTGE